MPAAMGIAAPMNNVMTAIAQTAMVVHSIARSNVLIYVEMEKWMRSLGRSATKGIRMPLLSAPHTADSLSLLPCAEMAEKIRAVGTEEMFYKRFSPWQMVTVWIGVSRMESGFLAPTLGASEALGTTYQQPYF